MTVDGKWRIAAGISRSYHVARKGLILRSIGASMVESYSYPKDLAELVIAKLRRIRSPGLRSKALAGLIEIAYFSSLRTEEAQPVVAGLSCLNPEDPDPRPPRRIRPDRWRSFRFQNFLPLTVSNLAKLAKATDPRTSLIAVYPNPDGDWIIWGIIDQALQWTGFVEHEIDGANEPPGDVILTIDAPGIISIHKGFSLVASLRHNTIIDRYLEVFEKGPISNRISIYAEEYVERVEQAIGHSLGDDGSLFAENWVTTFCRILLSAQSHRHGASFLVLPDASCESVNLKHSLMYDRLPRALISLAKEEFFTGVVREEIDAAEEGRVSPPNAWRDLSIAENEITDLRDELSGSIKTIGCMSRIDGAVVVDRSLNVLGFGAEIVADEKPIDVVYAGDPEGSEEFQRHVSYDHFGTRHRSVFRLCHRRPDILGFVISQDGEIRAIHEVNGRLIIWDNIQVRLSFPLRDSIRRRS